jgi:hypothetical protein
MESKAPKPDCKAFLICNQIVDDFETPGMVMIRLPLSCLNQKYPATQQLAFFTRWTSAQGEYLMEIQLQDEGKVVWRDGLRGPWLLTDPSRTYDLRLTLTVVFPKPGHYEFVLVVNGKELARQTFRALEARDGATLADECFGTSANQLRHDRTADKTTDEIGERITCQYDRSPMSRLALPASGLEVYPALTYDWTPRLEQGDEPQIVTGNK